MRKGGLQHAERVISQIKHFAAPFSIGVQLTVLSLDIYAIARGDPATDFQNIYWVRPAADLITVAYGLIVCGSLIYTEVLLKRTGAEFLQKQSTLFSAAPHSTMDVSHRTTQSDQQSSAMLPPPSPQQQITEVKLSPKQHVIRTASMTQQEHPLLGALLRVKRFTRAVTIIMALGALGLLGASISKLLDKNTSYSTADHYATDYAPLMYLQFVATGVTIKFIRPHHQQTAHSP